MFFAIAKNLLGTAKAESADSEEDVSLETLSDEELMRAYAGGEPAAFELLLKRHERGVYNYILRSCGRKDLAEELLQETFMRVIKSASRYKETAKFTTWVYTIARNLCIDRARKKSGKHEYSLDKSLGGDDEAGATFLDRVVDEQSSTSTSYDRAQFRERLASALDELPEEQREVFLMRQVSGLKFREIGDVLDVPVPTVKSRMRYALEHLRGRLAMYEDYSFDREDRKINSPDGG